MFQSKRTKSFNAQCQFLWNLEFQLYLQEQEQHQDKQYCKVQIQCCYFFNNHGSYSLLDLLFIYILFLKILYDYEGYQKYMNSRITEMLQDFLQKKDFHFSLPSLQIADLKSVYPLWYTHLPSVQFINYRGNIQGLLETIKTEIIRILLQRFNKKLKSLNIMLISGQKIRKSFHENIQFEGLEYIKILIKIY